MRIELPVRRITAYEDRAAFERDGDVDLPGGPVTLRIGGVSPLISDAHLSAGLLSGPPGAGVDDVTVERRWVASHLHGGESAERLLGLERDLAAAADQRFAAEQACNRAMERVAAAGRELGAYLEAVSRSAWHGVDVTATAAGHAALSAALREGDRLVDAARRNLHTQLETEQRLQGLLAEGRAVRQVLESVLCVRISGPAGAARLRVRGLYPCALWRPSHEAHLRTRPDGTTIVEWTTYATLWQRTGETWKDVEVSLSTARPGALAELPPLSEDRLRIRDRVPKPKVTVLAHRATAAARADLSDAAPGVYDGGEPRQWRADTPVTLPSDGRPHAVAVGRFETPARVNLLALPEESPQVFLRAVLKNSDRPLLAGPVVLLRDGARLGTGDLSYVGPGEPFELSFGTDDRFSLTYQRRSDTEERMLGRNRTVYFHEVELYSVAPEVVKIEVTLRLPVSELATVKIVPAEKFCTEGAPKPDSDGRVSVPIDVLPRRRRTLRLGFSIDSGADTQIPPPW